MESFSRGWSFLQQAWSMAFKDKDLIKPSIYALLVGMVVSIIGIIPIVISGFVFGTEGALGRGILVVFGALLVFVQFVVSYVFSAMTVYLIFGYVSDGDGRMDLLLGDYRTKKAASAGGKFEHEGYVWLYRRLPVAVPSGPGGDR